MEKLKKILLIIGIVCGILVASYFGILIFRFIWGIVVFGIFLCGAIIGFGIGRLFPRKPKKKE
ncbi:MAG: hypothetical protein AUJ97_06855 [Bacteroidetes bacterium CG2_30_32_10]|nr:MAG: hypothetical protein AUJ97_06855 [Bacteroidetes bacterium CG2_30_32_10]